MVGIELKNKLIKDYHLLSREENGRSGSYFKKIYSDAFETFERLGFPIVKSEEWKYTNLEPLLKNLYTSLNQTIQYDDYFTSLTSLYTIPSALKLFLINGKLEPDFSAINNLSEGVIIQSLPKAIKETPELVQPYYSQYADFHKEHFTALNTAFSREGIFIVINKGVSLSQPVFIYSITDSRNESFLSHHRILICAEQGASATIVEVEIFTGDNPACSNSVSEIFLHQNSTINYYKIQTQAHQEKCHYQNYLIDNTCAFLKKDSILNYLTLTFNTNFIRNNLNIMLSEPGAHTDLMGLYLLRKKQQVDNHTLVEHQSPFCTSNELYKGIMEDESTGVFNGKIIVRKDAQKTQAYQSNRNLLLSDSASINTKPQLEIFADDVKCSHGAVTGKLDEQALFYLRSRGIDYNGARALLTYAFASEIIEKSNNQELKEMLQNHIQAYFNK